MSRRYVASDDVAPDPEAICDRAGCGLRFDEHQDGVPGGGAWCTTDPDDGATFLISTRTFDRVVLGAALLAGLVMGVAAGMSCWGCR